MSNLQYAWFVDEIFKRWMDVISCEWQKNGTVVIQWSWKWLRSIAALHGSVSGHPFRQILVPPGSGSVLLAVVNFLLSRQRVLEQIPSMIQLWPGFKFQTLKIATRYFVCVYVHSYIFQLILTSCYICVLNMTIVCWGEKTIGRAKRFKGLWKLGLLRSPLASVIKIRPELAFIAT